MREIDPKKMYKTGAAVFFLLLFCAGIIYLICTDGLSPHGAEMKGELLLLNFRVAPVSGETAENETSLRARDGKSLYSLRLFDIWEQTKSGIRALIRRNSGRDAVMAAVFLLLNIVFWAQAQDGKKRIRPARTQQKAVKE